jgi:hypothetical protein
MSKYSDIRAERTLKNVVKPPRKKEFEYTLEGSIEDMQKIVDANEKLVKELKDGNKRTESV